MKIILTLLFAIFITRAQAQTDLSINDYAAIKWEAPHARPVLRPPFPSPVIADPSLLTPDQAPDGHWHLFVHSILGIHHYISADGKQWKRQPHVVIKKAIRPFAIMENGTCYLFYEKYDKLSPYASHLEMMQSKDLNNWSKAIVVLTADKKYSREGAPSGSVSNPYVVKTEGGYRLYFSAGLVYLRDCGFSEPRYVCYATSKSIAGPYEWADGVVIGPDSTDLYRNAGAGALKVLKATDGYVGYENGIAILKDKHSYSSVTLLSSHDGIAWSRVSAGPFLKPTSGWQRDYVYALDVKFYAGRFYLFYNARHGHHWISGRECIGVITGTLK